MSVEGHASQPRKTDTSVKIPDAVKRAAARSDALIIQNNPNAAPPPPEVPAKGAVTVARFDPSNPKPPEFGNPTAATVQPEPVVVPPEPEVDYKHQFESTQGRLSRSEQEKTHLMQRNNDLQRLLATMNNPPEPQIGGSEVRFGGGGAARKVTEKELGEYGPELIDVMRRAASEVYEPVMAQLQAELGVLKGQVGGVRNAVALDHTQQLYATLNQEIPNWQTINVDPNFLTWLNYPDELSGLPRSQLLATAFQQGQTARVAAAFRGFLAYQASFGPAGGAGQPQGNGAATLGSNTQPSASTPAVDLAALAAPGRAKSGQTNVPPEKPIVYKTEIATFYRELSLGKWKGRESEVAQIEQQIQSAVQEGRIR